MTEDVWGASVPEREDIDAFCPTCGKIVLVRVAASVRGKVTSDMFEEIDLEEAVGLPNYKVAFCVRCHSVFLFRIYRVSYSESDCSRIQRELLYPRESGDKRAPQGLPSSVDRPFKSASACLAVGEFEASVIMARKCLESLCRELGAPKGTLQKRLESLADRRVIDSKLLAWADELRIIGNDAAHDLDVDISHDDARDTLEFVEAILTYVFTLDRKFREFQARRGKGDATGQAGEYGA